MKKFFILTACAICISVFFGSCEKEYKYIPITNEGKPLNGNTITASSDSAAYYKAMHYYMTDLKNAYVFSSLTYPYDFIVVDSKKKVIEIDSFKKVELKNTVMKQYFGDDAPSLDDKKTQELLPFFETIIDKFSESKTTWYVPKDKGESINSPNDHWDHSSFGFYLYFGTFDNGLSPIHMVIDFTDYDWLFINKLKFLIDGEVIEYRPKKMKTNTLYGGKISEDSDEIVTISNRKLISKLLTADTVEVKIEGRQNYKEKQLSEEQILNIKRTIELYKAMGGFLVTKDLK